MTEKLYEENQYLTKSEANVTGVYAVDGQIRLTLDKTLFHPMGGGQTSDVGRIVRAGETYFVRDVRKADGEIYHIVDREGLKAGDAVQIEIDWEKRFDDMQRHNGEHILTGMFFKRTGGINRGFHMGENYMTIDISLEEEKTVPEITWEIVREVELMANEVIWANLPNIRQHFDTKEEAEKIPMRKKLEIERDITLVGIGDLYNRWGTVACSGTHPKSTGEVGLIKVIKAEPNKGMTRIYFEAGRRAFEMIRGEEEVLKGLAGRLSCKNEEVLRVYEKSEAIAREKARELTLIKKEISGEKAKEILERRAENNVFCFPLLGVGDYEQIAKEIAPELRRNEIVFLVSKKENTAILVGNEGNEKGGKFDMGKIVRECAGIYQGKGGGSPKEARAIFGKEEYLELFCELVNKHLR